MTLQALRQSLLATLQDGMSAGDDAAALSERVSKAALFDDFADDLIRDAEQLNREAHRPAPPAPQPTATFGIPQITMPLTVTTTPPDLTPIANAMSEQAVAMKALADRPNPANIINVEPPPATVVNVPAPIVNVTMPEPVEKASTPQDVRVVSMPTRTSTARKRVSRDRNGLITEVLEEEVEQ